MKDPKVLKALFQMVSKAEMALSLRKTWFVHMQWHQNQGIICWATRSQIYKAHKKYFIFSIIASESDNSSLNSTEDANNVFLTKRVANAASPNHIDCLEANSCSGYSNVISGSVTTVPIDGHSSDSDLASQVSLHYFFINWMMNTLIPFVCGCQEESLDFEVKKLRGKNLELLRQIHDHQLEFRRLRDRDLQLSSDLALATKYKIWLCPFLYNRKSFNYSINCREILKLKREKDNNNLPMRINSAATSQGIQRFSRWFPTAVINIYSIDIEPKLLSHEVSLNIKCKLYIIHW